MNYAQEDTVVPGDILMVDDGFNCMEPGMETVFSDGLGMYIHCSRGNHYISGQLDEKGFYVGLSHVA